MENIKPKLEVKIESEYVDEIVYNSALDEDQVILQQFEGEEDKVYLCLNSNQVRFDIDAIKDIIDMFTKRAEKAKALASIKSCSNNQ